MKHRALSQLLVLTLCMSASLACSNDAPKLEDVGGGDGTGGKDGSQVPVVEVVSWWVGPGEAEAFQALLNRHKENYPDARISNAAPADREAAQVLLAERFEGGNPPDLYQDNASGLAVTASQQPERLADLESVYDENGWREAFLSEALDDVTFNGAVYGIPLGIHRENALFFNKGELASSGLEVPRSIDELMTACETLKNEGKTCMAVAHQDWALDKMFRSVALGTMGGQGYYEHFSGTGDPDDPLVDEAISNFERLVNEFSDESYRETSFDWQSATETLFNGETVFFFHGDWAAGYLQQLGWQAGVDYGAVGAPGGEDVFIYGLDVFVLPSAASHAEAAKDLVRTMGSMEGQVAFNNIKGSTPVRLDIDPSELTPVAQESLQQLKDAKYIINPTYNYDLGGALVVFLRSGDADGLRNFIRVMVYEQ